MPNAFLQLRSSTAAARPANGTRQAGEIFLNLADHQIGYIDDAEHAVDLLAIRPFSIETTYAVGDVVVQDHTIWRARVTVTSGSAFSRAQWAAISLAVADANSVDLIARTASLEVAWKFKGTGAVEPPGGILALSSATPTMQIVLSGRLASETPAAAGDVVFLSARSTIAGAFMSLTGPLHTTPNRVSIAVGATPSQKIFAFLADGTLTTPGGLAVTATGGLAGIGAIPTWQMYFSSPSAISQYAVGYFWNFNHATGDLTYSSSSAARLFIGADGTFVVYSGNAFKPGGGPWSDTSDQDTKIGIVDYTSGLAKVIQLRPRRWRFRPQTGRDDTIWYTGLIGQETEDIMPELVKIGPGKLGDIEKDDMRSVDNTALTFALVNAIKELHTRIVALETGP